jgi:predicted O-methyltransferase YrrM
MLSVGLEVKYMSDAMLAKPSILETIKSFYRRRISLSLLDSLDKPFRDALISMYRGKPQLGDGDQMYEMENSGTKISPKQGMWLYDLCRKVKPQATLEIGLAYGFSMLFFLAALKKNGHGQHTAIDPFPWHGIAYAKARQVGMPLEVINELSERAGVDLTRAGTKFDVIFIDGNHRFDNVLCDFTLFANVCNMNGYIVLDDMWMKSVRAAWSFIRNNRSDFSCVSTPIRNIGVFKKVGEDKRRWDHFNSFSA